MKIDTAGTYTLRYTAEDECGNETVIDRSLIVSTPRTVLYTDGTLIINESSADTEENERLHGATTNVYTPFNRNGATDIEKYIFSQAADVPWTQQRSSVLSVEIGSRIKPTSTAYWFNYLSNCNNWDLTKLDTSLVSDMNNMFASCTLDPTAITHFDTSAVTDMSRMFSGLGGIAAPDVSHFDTSSVTNMEGMFRACRGLTTIDVSNFDTSSVTNMKSMFGACIRLQTIDISSFDTTNVTTMENMFEDCQELTSVNIGNMDVANVLTMKKMFYNCRALGTVDLSSFATPRLADTNSMFYYCQTLTTIFASSAFDTSQVTDSNIMFLSCRNLVGGAGTAWASSNPTDKTYAHIDGGTSNPGYFTLKTGA